MQEFSRRHALGTLAALIVTGRAPASSEPNFQTPDDKRPVDRRGPNLNVPPIPELARWKENMAKFGERHAKNLTYDPTNREAQLGNVYYDGQRVFLQIGDYMKAQGNNDPRWYKAAQVAQDVYLQGYLVPNQYRVQGFRNFSHGLTESALRNKDEAAKEAVLSLATEAAFAPDTRPAKDTERTDTSREVAYLIATLYNAEKLGAPHRARLDLLVDQAVGHLDQWFVSKTASHYHPYMIALTAEALILHYGKTKDERILPALVNAADKMWDSTWIPDKGAFMYMNVDSRKLDPKDPAYNSGGQTPEPDLNLLIAPLYSFLWRHTGEERFLVRGDTIFKNGVLQGNFDGPKQFNQAFRWSFQYVRDRSEPPLK